ncbi:MAG: TIGR03790 family protein, partial [Planctomycetes bacterium]|nr:TIGR03790 family protein [Planctomycetota bacterium]
MHRRLPALPAAAALCAAAALLAAPAALAGGGPQNLIVVVNDDSQESLDVANHYRLARKVPAACFCHLRVKPVHDFPRGDFEREILNPILEHVRKNGLEGHARFLVFTKGLPYRVDWNSTTKVSVTTPAAAGSMGIGHMNQQPYYQAKTHFRGLPGMPYLAVCLTGYTVEDVKRCIDQGVASDGTKPGGTIYLFDGVGPRARVHPAYGRDEAVAGLKELGIKFEVRPEHSLTAEQDVLGYWTGAVRVNTKGIRFLPGALADHLTSFGGILFDNKSQMSILDFIQAGATGSYGTVM